MNSNFIFRMPLKLPHETFGEEFIFDELRLDNAKAAHFILVSGDRAEQETGRVKVTFDAVLRNRGVIEGISFKKKYADIMGYYEVKEDEFDLEDCPVWREYMITDRMLGMYDLDRVRMKVSAVDNSRTPCCIFIEGTDFRYASETMFSYDRAPDDHDNGNQGGNQNGGNNDGNDTGPGDGQGGDNGSGTGDGTGTGDGPGGGENVNP